MDARGIYSAKKPTDARKFANGGHLVYWLTQTSLVVCKCRFIVKNSDQFSSSIERVVTARPLLSA